MEMTITLNNGVVLEFSQIFLSGDIVYVYIRNGYGIKQVFDLFIDPENTSIMTTKEPGKENRYEGYTKLICVKDEEHNLITAMLRKWSNA